jgi:hydrogenase expression/formation protein HypC
MCLAVPVRIAQIGAGDMAIAEIDGVRKEISLALLDDVQVGDYVILHVGYAISRLDEAEAHQTLALFAELGQRPAQRSA